MRHRALLIAVLGAPTVAIAQVDFFTTKEAFDDASDATLGITFEEAAWDPYVGVNGPTPKSFNGITFESLAAPNLVVAPAGQANFGVPPLSRVLTVSGNEHVDLLFDDPPTAVGFVFYANGFDPATITVELVGGEQVAWTNEQAPDTIGYVGIVAAEPIARVNWLAVGGETINTGIDDVAWDTAVCSVDCNADGQLNVLDFVCFQGAWSSQAVGGDCNGDGAFNVLDFVCYQGAFVAGCP